MTEQPFGPAAWLAEAEALGRKVLLCEARGPGQWYTFISEPIPPKDLERNHALMLQIGPGEQGERNRQALVKHMWDTGRTWSPYEQSA